MSGTPSVVNRASGFLKHEACFCLERTSIRAGFSLPDTRCCIRPRTIWEEPGNPKGERILTKLSKKWKPKCELGISSHLGGKILVSCPIYILNLLSFWLICPTHSGKWGFFDSLNRNLKHYWGYITNHNYKSIQGSPINTKAPQKKGLGKPYRSFTILNSLRAACLRAWHRFIFPERIFL